MKKTRHGNVDTLRATWWSRSLRLTASQLILWGPHCSGKTYIYSIFIPPTSMKLKGGYTGFMLFVRPCLRPSLDGIVSALYLRQYLLDSYPIYSSHQATSKSVSCVKLFAKLQNLNFCQSLEICSFDFVLFWLGIHYESVVHVWVIMGQEGGGVYSQNGGYTGFMLFVSPCLRPSLDGIVSALYLRQYLLDSYHIYSSHQATSKSVSRVKLAAKFQNLNFWQSL